MNTSSPDVPAAALPLIPRARAGGSVVAVVSLLVTSVGSGQPVAAQERPSLVDARIGSVSRRIDSITPTSGPPGTTVILRTGGLPAITPMRIGMGATRLGFEEIGQVMTNERGELSFSVEVPAWTQHHLTHVFIVFDFYFNPIALSDVFDVTGPDGTVLRNGRITREGAECPSLRTEEGVVYGLSGDLGDFEPGDVVAVEGTIAESRVCGEGTTIEIVRVRSGGSGP